MKIIEIKKDGTTKEQDILRKTLATRLGIHLRDLRPVFVGKQVATITPRNGTIILNFGEIKMIVTSTGVFLSNLDEKRISKDLIPKLVENIKNNKSDSFEFLVLDFALSYKVKNSQNKFEMIDRKVQALLRKIQKDFTEKNLTELLQLKKKISRFKINIEENESAVLEVLENENELADLYLGMKKTDNEVDTVEAESILESFLEQIEDINHKLTRLEEDIDDTQEIITLTLNNRRNTIIRLDLGATIITGILSLLTLITGVFGMNIKNNMEQSHQAFIWVLIVMGILFTILSLISWVFFRRKKLI